MFIPGSRGPTGWVGKDDVGTGRDIWCMQTQLYSPVYVHAWSLHTCTPILITHQDWEEGVYRRRGFTTHTFPCNFNFEILYFNNNLTLHTQERQGAKHPFRQGQIEHNYSPPTSGSPTIFIILLYNQTTVSHSTWTLFNLVTWGTLSTHLRWDFQVDLSLQPPSHLNG